MDKALRIWIDGELLVDTSVAEDQEASLAAAWETAAALAAKPGQPWRVELGDLDADVQDRHWRSSHQPE